MEINKSLRISLTEKCNYRCFFCHEEGLDMSKKRIPKTKEEVYDLIEVALENGYNDLTFTGGEPLIKKKDIQWYFKKLDEKKMYPDITIVTNGFLMDDELLECVSRYKGNFKFNISLHSLNPEDYEKIICLAENLNSGKVMDVRFKKVVENIRKAKLRNLNIKLNFVLLKGINTGKDKIREILEFALQNNIDYIKFLELLVIEGKEKLYKYFTEIEQIEEVWKDELKLLSKDIPRRKLYMYKDKLKVELQKCTCSFGCSNCLKNRDVNLTAELKYFPCFILSDENYEVKRENLLEKVKLGNEKIIGFAKKYGEDSPLLIKKRKFIVEKTEFYYKSNLDIKNIIGTLKENGYRLYQTFETKERYYTTENDFEIKKIYVHSHNDSKYTEIIQNYFLDNNTKGIKIRYINRGIYNKPKEVNNLEEYENNLENERSRFLEELNWHIDIYRNHNDEKISIGIEKNNNQTFILSFQNEIKSEEILKKAELEKVSNLPIKHILNNKNKN